MPILPRLIVAVFIFFPLVSQADDWPQFRGPQSRGVAQAPLALLTDIGPEKHVLWKTALRRGIRRRRSWETRFF